jgi:hypothetical protein
VEMKYTCIGYILYFAFSLLSLAIHATALGHEIGLTARQKHSNLLQESHHCQIGSGGVRSLTRGRNKGTRKHLRIDAGSCKRPTGKGPIFMKDCVIGTVRRAKKRNGLILAYFTSSHCKKGGLHFQVTD